MLGYNTDPFREKKKAYAWEELAGNFVDGVSYNSS